MTCLLVEHASGLVLIDAGFARSTRRTPWRNPGVIFNAFARTDLGPGEPAIERLQALGRHPEAVTDIVLTHLDPDHAGGLEDFPRARVHVARAELAAKTEQWWNPRYNAGIFRHGPRFELHDLLRQETLGFALSRDLFGDGAIVLLGAPGHSRGHMAIAVRTAAGHVVHTGDAVYLESEARRGDSGLGPGLRLLRRLVDDDRREQKKTREVVARLLRQDGVTVVTSHDEAGLARLAPFPYPIASL
jgi:glyoxylase-like metal-dependent hydrolase (beta-lactamase superfamily II)